MKYTKEQWEKIKEKFNKGQLLFSVELANSRKFLVEEKSKKIIIKYFISFLIFVIECFLCIISLHSIGIFFIFAYTIVFYKIIGLASVDLAKTQNIIIVLSIIACVILFFSSISVFLLLMVADLSFLSVYDFYHTVGTTIIDDFILKDYMTFNKLLDKRCFYVKEK